MGLSRRNLTIDNISSNQRSLNLQESIDLQSNSVLEESKFFTRKSLFQEVTVKQLRSLENKAAIVIQKSFKAILHKMKEKREREMVQEIIMS